MEISKKASKRKFLFHGRVEISVSAINGDDKKWKLSVVFDFTCKFNIAVSVVKAGEKRLHKVVTPKKENTVISISSIM